MSLRSAVFSAWSEYLWRQRIFLPVSYEWFSGILLSGGNSKDPISITGRELASHSGRRINNRVHCERRPSRPLSLAMRTSHCRHDCRCITNSHRATHGTSAVHSSSKLNTANSAANLLTNAKSLIDDIINSVNELVYQGISSLENGLFSTPPEKLGFSPAAPSTAAASASEDGHEYLQAKQEIEEGLHKLETLLESTVDKNFDRFEIYVLRNILSVPEDLSCWIRLSHYEVCSQTRGLLLHAFPRWCSEILLL